MGNLDKIQYMFLLPRPMTPGVDVHHHPVVEDALLADHIVLANDPDLFINLDPPLLEEGPSLDLFVRLVKVENRCPVINFALIS